jgi:hypothetical protein
MQKPILLQDLGMIYPTEKSKQKTRYGLYKCYCGNEFKANTNSINSNGTRSCGCYQKEIAKQTIIKNASTHNLSLTRLHIIWKNMKQRCYNKNNPSYKLHYGSKGITICEEWKNNFMIFHNWAINNGYDINLTIDRINPKGNYEPNNCRWATAYTQAKNISITKANTSGYKNVSQTQSDTFVSYIGVNKKRIHLGSFRSAKEAAEAFNNYVIKNKLEHTLNKIV